MAVLITIMIGIVVTLVVLWVVLLIGLAWLRPQGSTLRDAARIVPDTVRLVHRLAGDPSLGRGVRLRLFVLLAYLALPIDLVPDIIPVVGYVDDVIVIGVVLRSVMRHAGGEVVRRHWPGSPRASWCSRDSAGYPDQATVNDTQVAGSDEYGWAQSDQTHRRDVLEAGPGPPQLHAVLARSLWLLASSFGRDVRCSWRHAALGAAAGPNDGTYRLIHG